MTNQQTQTQVIETTAPPLASEPKTAPRELYNVGLIVPAVSKSGVPLDAIVKAINQTAARLSKRAERENEAITLHYMTGKKDLTYAPNSNPIERSTEKTPHITTKAYTPKTHGGKAYFSTAGRLAANIDALVIVTGKNPALTKGEKQISATVKKAGKPIVIIAAPVEPTPESKIPAKAKPALPQAAYRINIRKYSDWNALKADPATAVTDATGKTHHPIYTGGTNKGKGVTASPLENPIGIRGTANWKADYKEHLWKKIQANDPAVMDALRKITPITPLVCWCEPQKECHTDIIRAAAAYVKDADRALKPTAAALTAELKDAQKRERAHRVLLLKAQHATLAAMTEPKPKQTINAATAAKLTRMILEQKDLENAHAESLIAIVETSKALDAALLAEETTRAAATRAEKAAKAKEEEIAIAAASIANRKAKAKDANARQLNLAPGFPITRCTAKTQKGTRCTRKAKTAGKCTQHATA